MFEIFTNCLNAYFKMFEDMFAQCLSEDMCTQ